MNSLKKIVSSDIEATDEEWWQFSVACDNTIEARVKSWSELYSTESSDSQFEANKIKRDKIKEDISAATDAIISFVDRLDNTCHSTVARVIVPKM